MAEEKMTLVDRLNNPARDPSGTLLESVTQDMRDAATAVNSHADLVKALEEIRGGSFEGASTLAVSGSWQLFAERLQKIAATALSNPTMGREELAVQS